LALMSNEITYLLRDGNLQKMVKVAKSDPFPGVIGTFMGRDALALAVSCLDLKPNDTVLLPAYLCREVLRPFLGKTKVIFYDIQPDLTVDPEEIRLKLSDAAIRMMLIINYFGFLQPYREEIRAICKERGVLLMEDCAHSLLTEGSGETGDLSIYSFRKIISVPDGGGLKINPGGRGVAAAFYPKIFANVLSVLITLKSLLKVRGATFSRAGLADRTGERAPSGKAAKKNRRILPLSSFAYNGMGNTSFRDVIDWRRRDYLYWQELAERTHRFVPAFRNLLPGVCPLGFPVLIKDRDSVKLRLLEKGIMLRIHWHLPDEVGSDFVHSHNLSRQTITLPVYPELSDRERAEIEGLFAS
jgi:perosamine synthetase